MKRFSSLVFAAAVVLASSPSAALPQGLPFTLVIQDGPAGETGVGSIWFALDGDTGGSCRYWGEWADEPGAVANDCWIDVAKTHRRASCVDDQASAWGTTLRKDSARRCRGFDTLGLARDVFTFVAVGGDDGFVGLIQWSAAGPYLAPLEGTPYP